MFLVVAFAPILDGINSADPTGLASDGGLVFHLGAEKDVYQPPPTFLKALIQNFPGWNIFAAGINNVKNDPIGYAIAVIPGGELAGPVSNLLKPIAEKAIGNALKREVIGTLAGGFNKLAKAIKDTAVHGNSNLRVDKIYGYILRNNQGNEILHIGETLAYRLNQRFLEDLQVLADKGVIPKGYDPNWYTIDPVETFWIKQAAKDWERNLIQAYERLHGARPRGNFANH